MRQYDIEVRDALLAAWIAAIGPSPILQLRTGAQPVNCQAATTGTLIVEMTLPSVWMGTPVDGVSNLSGTWQGTSVATGVPQHFRVFAASSPAECRYQGSVTKAFSRATSGTTAINNNVINFASTTGIVVGASIAGTGIPTGATVAAVDSSTVTMSAISTTGVASGADIYFGDTSGDLWLANTSIAMSQTVSVTRHRMVAPGA